MQDDQVTELAGFDARGVLVGRAFVAWDTGNWTVMAGKSITCNVWTRSEAEGILRQNAAVDIREGDGRK